MVPLALLVLLVLLRVEDAEALNALCELEAQLLVREGTSAIELAEVHSKWRRERAR